MIEIVHNFGGAFLLGLSVTLQLALVVWISGLGCGFLFGAAAASHPSTVGRVLSLGAFVLSGIPLLVLLFWLHYPLQALLNIVIDPFVTAAFTLGLVNTFSTADTVRRALVEFPRQYIIAAQVSGLNSRQILLHIKLPILLRQLIPELLTYQVVMLQATLFASLISVEELFRVAQRINALIYRPIQIYSALGLFFVAICLPLNGLAIWLKQHATRNISET